MSFRGVAARRAVVDGARTLACVVLVLAAASCDQGKAGSGDEAEAAPAEERAPSVGLGAGAPPGGLIKIILQPEGQEGPEDQEGEVAAPVELMLEIAPPAMTDDWVESFATLVNQALERCEHEPEELRAEVMLEVERGAIALGEGDGALATCLASELVGADVLHLGDDPRSLRLRIHGMSR